MSQSNLRSKHFRRVLRVFRCVNARKNGGTGEGRGERGNAFPLPSLPSPLLRFTFQYLRSQKAKTHKTPTEALATQAKQYSTVYS